MSIVKYGNTFSIVNIVGIFSIVSIVICNIDLVSADCQETVRHPENNFRELKQRQRRRQRERHKTIGLISKNNRSARALYVFVHFFAVLCKTTT